MGRGYFLFLCIIFLLVISVNAQHGDPNNRRSGLLNANNFHSVFLNTGVLAQPTNYSPRGAWKGDHNGYFGDMSFVIGVELPIKDYDGNGTLDTFHTVIINSVD